MCGSKDRLSTTLVVVNWSLLIHPFFNVCNNRLWQVSASYLVLFSLLSIEFLLIEITVSSSFLCRWPSPVSVCTPCAHMSAFWYHWLSLITQLHRFYVLSFCIDAWSLIISKYIYDINALLTLSQRPFEHAGIFVTVEHNGVER